HARGARGPTAASRLEHPRGEETMASEKVQGIIDQLNTLNVLEISELSKTLQELWGVTAAAPVAAAAAPAGGGGGAAAAAPAEEQTEFVVVLKEAGPNKINVIKVVR